MVDFDGDLGEQAASELSARGTPTLLTVGDVAEPETAERACQQALDEWGRIDILVNNAGIGGINGNIWELPVEEMDRVYRTNLRGVFCFTHSVVPHMLERRLRPDRQHRLGRGQRGQSQDGPLLSDQGGGDRPDQVRWQGACGHWGSG